MESFFSEQEQEAKNDSDHLWTIRCKLTRLMTPEGKASYKDSFVKFNVKKENVNSISSGKTCFHTLESTIAFHQVFV